MRRTTVALILLGGWIVFSQAPVGLLGGGGGPAFALGIQGKELAMAEAGMQKPEAPPWLGSREGISEEVLPPWTPLQVEGPAGEKRAMALRPWGRVYELAGVFPERIETAGENVLAGPIRVTARVNGQEEKWGKGTVTVQEQTPAKVQLNASVEGNHLTLRGTITAEYDGCLRLDWEVAPLPSILAGGAGGPNLTLGELTFEIPLRAENAKYLYHYPGRWGSAYNAGALRPEGFTAGFRPFLWLGDEDRGLAWFSESDQNWFNPDESRVTEIVREGDRVTLRLHLVRQPVAMADEPATSLSYTFGLQATPVKPNPQDVWDYRICHAGNYGIEEATDQQPSILDRLAQLGVRTICFHEHWTDIQNYTSTTHGEALRRLVQACHARGLRLLLYFGYEMSNIAPEWPLYSEECLVFPRAGGYHRLPEQNAYIVCYRSHWQDFMAQGIARMMDEYDIDGVYLDGTANPWGCRNVRHGCGYTRPDGSVGTTYPFWATRQMMRRIYTLVKARKPDGQVNVHQSTCMTIPTLAWATSYWDGEQFGGLERGPFALETLPLDAFRTEFMGHQWGVPAEFLCYERPYTYREALSFTLLHDVLVRGSNLGPNLELESQLWRVSDAFGRKEAEWLPYWRNQAFVTVTPEAAQASLYRHPRHGTLFVVSNLGREESEVTVKLNFPALGLPAEAAAHDALTQEALPWVDGTLHFKLPPLDWRLVWVKGPGD